MSDTTTALVLLAVSAIVAGAAGSIIFMLWRKSVREHREHIADGEKLVGDLLMIDARRSERTLH